MWDSTVAAQAHCVLPSLSSGSITPLLAFPTQLEKQSVAENESTEPQAGSRLTVEFTKIHSWELGNVCFRGFNLM